MGLYREIRLVMALLIAAILLTAFGAIALLDRMSPAIERILAENVHSLAAGADMLRALAETADGPAGEDAAAAYLAAMARARGNVTEEGEGPLLDALAAIGPQALSGDAALRRRATDLIGRLTALNRDAMVQADSKAKRLGRAGAWSMVILGFTSFGGALLLFGRVRRVAIEPITELHAVAAAFQAGDTLRRCRPPGPAAAPELAVVARTLNTLIDEAASRSSPDGRSRDAADRPLLVALLDAGDEPQAVVADDGAVRAASRTALERLQGPAGPALRTALRVAVEKGGRPGGPVVRARRLGDAGPWLCTLDGGAKGLPEPGPPE